MNDPTSAISKRGIHVLCAEILSEIFLIASHSSLDERTEADDTIFLKPLLDGEPCSLTRVCKEWRKVALSTPQLWTHIEVDIGYPESESETKESSKAQRKEHYAKQLDMVVIWLRLSRNMPLMLYLRIYGNKPLPSELAETFVRWNVLCLKQAQSWVRKTETVTSSILQDLLPGKANTLQRLEMESRSRSSKNELPLKYCPNLKHLRAGGVTVIPIKSHRLESLRGSWRPGTLLRYLQLFEHLKILHAEFRSGDTGLDDVVTSQLETLKVTGELYSMSTFFSQVNLPALRSADITLDFDAGDNDRENQVYYEEAIEGTIPQFFEEKSPNLTKLRLSGGLIDGAEACNYLRATPLLVELSLQVKTLKVAEVRSIIGGEKNKICPKLNFLDLYVHGPCRISADNLVRALQSRFGKNKSMTIRLHLGCKNNLIEQITNDARIKKLQEDYAFTLDFH